MYALILSLLPAITVLIVALIIKRLNYALLLGLCVAAIIVTKTVSVATITFLMARLWAQLTVPDALYLYGFLLVLGVLITVIEHSGGTAAFSRLLTRRLTDARSTETSIVALSSSLFIDDYLSMLTTGNIMRPIIKNYAIAPEKLAWIIHALSSPLVIIAPLSTWIAMTTSQLEQAGIRCLNCPATTIIDDAYFLFLNTIPFILYSFLTMIILLLIIRLKISYGPMHAKEQAAALLKPEPVTVHADQQVQGSALNLLLPIAILITSFIVGILWDGHFFATGRP